MEEKIIIDGVDVSECKYYVTYTKDCINDNKSYNKCESYKDCYYKQLKRLEQENEELKSILNGKTFFCGNCEKLQKENEELKEKYQQAHDDFITSDACLRIANTEKDKLEHALEEIKELCKRQDLNQGMRTFEILKVITEAIGE